MAKFRDLAEYERSVSDGYRPLPYRFMPLHNDRYVLTNMAGEFAVMERDTLDVFARGTLSYQSEVYDELKSKHFLIDGDSDVSLDLQGVFETIYDRAGYGYSVDYSAELDPPLSQEDAAWVAAVLSPTPA